MVLTCLTVGIPDRRRIAELGYNEFHVEILALCRPVCPPRCWLV